MTTDTNVISELLGEEITQNAITELGMQNASKEVQAPLLAMIGQGIVERVTLELLTALPSSERDRFEQLVGSGNGAQMREFLERHIPDLEQFVMQHAEREYEALKTSIVMAREGV